MPIDNNDLDSLSTYPDTFWKFDLDFVYDFSITYPDRSIIVKVL